MEQLVRILLAELVVVGISVTYLYLLLNRKQAVELIVAERTGALHRAAEELVLARKTAEKNATRYRKLLEISPDAILLGRNGVILMANEAAVLLFRVGCAAELVGRSFIDLVAPESGDRVICGGGVVDVEIAKASYLDENGANAQWVIRDVTERKRAEETLRFSEARLRGITDSAQDAILMMDPCGAISFWNPAAESILGYECEEAIGQNLHQLLVPERYLEAHRAAFGKFLRTGCGDVIGKTVELPARRKDGREIAVALSLSALCLNGEWHAIGIIRDITKRKQAEQSVRDSEERFRQLADSIREVFFVFDASANKTLYVSPAYEQIWGMSREGLFENSLAWQDAVHPEDLEKTRILADMRRNGEPVQFEYRIRTPDGVEKWIRSQSFPVRGSSGRSQQSSRNRGGDYGTEAVRGGVDPRARRRRRR